MGRARLAGSHITVAKGKKNKSEAQSSGRQTTDSRAAGTNRGGRWQPAYARAKSEKEDPIDWKLAISSGLCVLLIAFTTQIFSINDGLVLNDRSNLSYIFNPAKIGEAAEKSLDQMFSRPLMQPWTKHSLISDRTDYKGEVKWFHGANILFHCAAAGYLFVFVFRLVRSLVWQKRTTLSPYYTALAAATVFATHPFTTATVSHLSARGALLGTTNFLLSLNLLLVGLLSKNQIVGSIGFGLALYTGCMAIWSAPEMVSLPAVALLVTLLVKNPLSEWKKSFQEKPFLLGITSVLAIGVPFLALRGFEPVVATNVGLPTLDTISYVASQIKALPLYYLRCFAFPLGLSIDPPMAIASGFSDPLVWVSLVLIAGLIYLAFRSKSILVALGVVLMAAGFIPHAVFIQPDAVSDWVAYLPLTGVALLIGEFIGKRAAKNTKNAMFLLIALLVLYCDLTIFRDWQWGSNLTLWKSALEVRPKSALANAMLAVELAKRQDLSEAEKLADKAVSLDPNMALARLAKATVLLQMQKYKEAETQLLGATNLAESQKLPEKVKKDILFGLVEAYLFQGRFDLAQPLRGKLVGGGADTQDARAYRLAGLAAFKGGQYKVAWEGLAEAANMDSDMATCWEPMALIALEVGRADLAFTAASNYKEQLDSDHARLLLARAALASGKTQMGIDLLEQLLRKNPNNGRAALVLSKHYKSAGKEDLAKRYREQAVKAMPDVELKYSLPEFLRLIPGVAPEPQSGSPAAPVTPQPPATPATPSAPPTPPPPSPTSPAATTPASPPSTPGTAPAAPPASSSSPTSGTTSQPSSPGTTSDAPKPQDSK